MKFIYNINKINKYIGETISWLTLLMVLVTVLVVILRYGFSIGLWLDQIN